VSGEQWWSDEDVCAAAEAIEDEAIVSIGRDLGTIHRDDIVRAGLAALAPTVERIRREAKAEALREFADRFRPGDGNPWALHVRARARRVADRIEAD
jgi:hypothetical protein